MPLTPEEVKELVRQTIREEREQAEEKLDTSVLKTLSAILTGFGIEPDEKADIREDFRYLRKWRRGSDKITGAGMMALAAFFVGGIASALVLGIKAMLGKP